MNEKMILQSPTPEPKPATDPTTIAASDHATNALPPTHSTHPADPAPLASAPSGTRTPRHAAAAPVIRVDGLTRRYGTFTAVDAISFEVPAGTVFGLLGTNGAGKTSALEVIEGLAPAASGTAEVLGMDPLADRARLRPMIGIMMQEGGFPYELTVRETARMWNGTLTRPLTVDHALDLVDLGERADRPVKALSGGERRRLDLALAVMGRPAVLFLDEPTTGLDPESRHAAWKLITALRDAGTTLVLTTHYMDEAERLCDTLAIMHSGRIVEHGTVSQILAENPATITFEPLARHAADPGTAPTTSASAFSSALSALPLSGTVAEVPAGRAGSGHPALTVSTTDLQADLHTLLGWAERERVELRGLRAQEADLEQVFLGIAESRAAA